MVLGGGVLGGFGFGFGFGAGPGNLFGGLLGGFFGPASNGIRMPMGGVSGPPPEIPFALHAAALTLMCVPAAAMLIRRRWPIAALIVTGLCFGVAAWLGFPSTAAGIGLSIAAYALAYRASRRLAFAIAGAIAVLILVLGFALTQWESLEPGVVQICAAVLIAAALGDSARSRREYLLAVTERAERAERTREAEAERRVAEERLRIAQDLHDTVAHRIAVISLNAGVASGAVSARPERALEALGTIRQASRTVLAEIGDLMHYLRSDENGGAAAPPQPGLAMLGDLIEGVRSTGLEISAALPEHLDRVEGVVEQVAYRVVQEGLTNAHKHGSEHRATLRIELRSDALEIEVNNPVDETSRNLREQLGEGFGITGLRERVASVGGSTEAGQLGAGYRLFVHLPVTQASVRDRVENR